MIIYNINLCTSCIAFILVSLLPTAIDPVEQECEELPELAPVEATNLEQDQSDALKWVRMS
jgi:hypothetical protein